jgi:hypothetical protein
LRTRVRPHADRGVQAVRSAPSWAHIAGAGAVAVVLLAGVLGLTALFDDGVQQSSRTVAKPSAAPSAATDVQEHRDQRGFAVNVPKDWQQKKPASGSYVDYVDPANGDRRIRINVEAAGATPAQFAEVAEGYLRSHANVCEAPYQRVALRSDVQLAALPAAEWEYTCGSGDRLRHGIWRALAQNGKAYTFYLSVPDSVFAQSRPIYDEMVRSYRFGA